MKGAEEIKDARIHQGMGVEDLIKAYGDIHGFMAGHIYEASSILLDGIKESEIRVLSFTGNLISTGLRGIIAQLIENRLFNVVVTTCGALDHDIARAYGGKYLKGYFEADDVELYRQEVHRLGNVYIRIEDYGLKVEGFVRKLVSEALKLKKEWGMYELLREAGRLIDDKNSFLRSAAETGADVFVPGWPDGSFGTSLFMEKGRGNEIKIDYFRDMERLSEIFFSEGKKALALIIGGGISKHHTIWWSQFKGGLDYVVYLTTALEWDGSLSGAMPREAITWGKVKPSARKVIVYGDATITLPLLASHLLNSTR
ncbi:MAG: deoxyhypusine synthase [Caldisphaeraceae archaeon]|nr:deoxyhypusine synthase [Caldisphaeraceae archaeon]MEB3692252.1 deoxyhypusine synthase [Caldisphaeraceae archaeon]MEB3797331.1 deoxyhypusine synthase [Caldisphaeraceae archaeon]